MWERRIQASKTALSGFTDRQIGRAPIATAGAANSKLKLEQLTFEQLILRSAQPREDGCPEAFCLPWRAIRYHGHLLVVAAAAAVAGCLIPTAQLRSSLFTAVDPTRSEGVRMYIHASVLALEFVISAHAGSGTHQPQVSRQPWEGTKVQTDRTCEVPWDGGTSHTVVASVRANETVDEVRRQGRKKVCTHGKRLGIGTPSVGATKLAVPRSS